MSGERRLRLLHGAVAASPALAAGWVAHRGAARIPFAPTALADRVIRLTPGDVATTAIDRLHHAAQPLLAGGIPVVFVAIAAAAAASLRPSRASLAWGAALLATGAATPVERSVPGALAGAALGGGSYWLALRALRWPGSVPSDRGRRRALVSIGALTTGVLIASHPLARAIAALAGRPRGLSASGLPRFATPPRLPFPRIAGLSPEVTSVADHYVVDIDINDPMIDGPGWRLRVLGLVERPLELGFLDLQRQFTPVEDTSVLTCISNQVGGPLVGSSRWAGVRLAELLDRAGVRPSASALIVRCADGYSAGISLAAGRHPSALVAIAQDGQALAREHGFPCRLRLPALYGMLNPKWVTSIELVDRPYRGYWAQQGWSATAVVRTESRIDTPHRARVGEPTWIAGVAWAGVRGIRAVQVSLDEGRSWQPARLRTPLSPWAWTQWAYRWTPQRAGGQPVRCRAIDDTAAVQDPGRRPPHPSGASGYHRVDIEVA